VTYFDELIIRKNKVTRIGEFTPPATANTYDDEIGNREYSTSLPFGNQSSGFEVSYADLLSAGLAINTGDFTIEVRWRIECDYEMLTDDPDIRYAICGQYTDSLWDENSGTTEGSYWSLEFVDDEFKFRVWDSSSGTFKVNVTAVATINWATEWTDHRKNNLDEEFIEIAVVRSGSLVRIFINGVNVAEGSAADSDLIESSLQINGQTGRLVPSLPFSITYISGLRITDSALYWDDYTPSSMSFDQPPGIAIFPRMYPVLYQGDPGDMIGVLGITFGFDCSMAYLGIVNPGIDLSIPALEFYGYGIVNQFGTFNISVPVVTVNFTGITDALGTIDAIIPSISVSFEGNDPPVGTLNISIPSIRFDSDGIINENGTLDLTLPSLMFEGFSIEGIIGNIDVTIPALGSLFTGISSTEGTLSITIPCLRIFFSTEATNYLNMVINLKNRALTIYDNYDFNSLCRFNNINLGADSSNIYNLDSGTTDEGTHITWNLRTGYLDLEQKTKKRLRQAWLSYNSTGDILITIIQPDGSEFEYILTGIGITDTGLRIKFGKGISSKYIALDLTNIDNSSITLDVIKLYLENIGGVR
jgi:hypothetical protein